MTSEDGDESQSPYSKTCFQIGSYQISTLLRTQFDGAAAQIRDYPLTECFCIVLGFISRSGFIPRRVIGDLLLMWLFPIFQPSYRHASIRETARSIFPFCDYFFKKWSKRNRMLFATLFHCWREIKMESFCSWEKEIWSSKNNVWLNCNDSDYVLIRARDVDFGDGRTIRMSFFLWSFKKAQNAWSVVVM
jgi:hypothetical protein